MNVNFKTIGCRTNQEEVQTLMAALAERGDFVIVDDVGSADVVVINTCSVTAHTESKCGRFIQALRDDAPNAKVLVTGCFAQQHGEKLLEKYPHVQWVVGNNDKYKIPQILSSENNDGAYLSDDGNLFPAPTITPIQNNSVTPGFRRTRFSMKIQEGCDFHCAYCIVPTLRGRSRSASSAQLVDTFKRALDAGYKEIVLTGTHIGQYKSVSYDIDQHNINQRNINQHNIDSHNIDRHKITLHNNTKNLESLLEKLLAVNGDYRVRLSSLDPRDLTDSIIALAGEHERVCDHLHVSVQSLCADVLARMSRPYENLDALVEKLYIYRQKYPYAGLGGDFIAGHPGEDDAMFNYTLRNVSNIGFTYGHVFRYSKRAGTAAAEMPGQVAENVKKMRAEKLRDKLSDNHKKFLSSLVSRPLYIIVEKTAPVRGVAGNYLDVTVERGDADIKHNDLVKVIVTRVDDGKCYAKVADDQGDCGSSPQ